MEFTIKLAEDNTYVECLVKGEMNTCDALKVDIEVQTFGRKKYLNKYFYDMTKCKNVSSTLDNYQFAYKDRICPEIDRSAKIAVLVSPEDHSHDFVELVLINSGFNICFFRDRRLAEIFLRG